METARETDRMFRCPRCQHTELETVPHRTRCPRCGMAIPRPEREYFHESRNRRLMQRQM